MNKLEQEIETILLEYYDNPIGGDKTTHWYINDVVKRKLKKLFCRRIDEVKIKVRIINNAVYWNENWVVEPEVLASAIAKELRGDIG